jgi:hypothetical protein
MSSRLIVPFRVFVAWSSAGLKLAGGRKRNGTKLVVMTATQHGGPGAPYGQPGAPVPGGPPVPPGAPPGYDWRYAPPPPRRSKVLAAGVVVAIVLATAALVVGIVDLSRSTSTSAATAPTSAAPTTPTPAGDTSGADRALCTAIAPLMAESDRVDTAYVKLGDAGTPARDAATPKFITDTEDWVGRVQPILDQHPDASPYLSRTLQRFLDDRNLMVSDMDPGPLTSYAQTLWSDSTGAYAGPLHVCYDLGVKW